MANGVTVLGEPGVDNAVGVIVRTGAILRNSLVRAPHTGNANQAIGAEGGTLIENISAAGDKMVDARDAGSPVVIRRLRSSTPSPEGIFALGAGSVNVSDALIRLSGGSIGGGLVAEATAAGSPMIVARYVTVVGTGDAVNAGRGGLRGRLQRGTKPDGGRARLDLPRPQHRPRGRGVLGKRRSHPDRLLRLQPGQGGRHERRRRPRWSPEPGTCWPTPVSWTAPPPTSGCARLAAARPRLPGAGSTADLDGRPRPNDGNGDGPAVHDPGAFEYSRLRHRP